MDTSHPLRVFREAQEPPLSQQQLAELCDVTREAVNRWESGARKIDDQKLPTVVKVTGIPPAVLRPDLAKLMGLNEAAE